MQYHLKKRVAFLAAYFVITMAWAYPWHVVWFHDLYQSWGAMTREHPIMPPWHSSNTDSGGCDRLSLPLVV